MIDELLQKQERRILIVSKQTYVRGKDMPNAFGHILQDSIPSIRRLEDQCILTMKQRQLIKRPCATYTCAVVLPSDITSRSEWRCNHLGPLPPALPILAAATDLLAPSLSQSAPLAAPTDSSRLVPELLL